MKLKGKAWLNGSWLKLSLYLLLKKHFAFETNPLSPTEGFIGSLAVDPHACLHQQCTHFDAIHLTKQNNKKIPKLLAITAMMHLPAFRQAPLLTCFPLEHIKFGTRSRSKRELKTDHNKLPKQERGGNKKKNQKKPYYRNSNPASTRPWVTSPPLQ